MTAYTATLNGVTIGDGTGYLWQTEPQGLGPGAYSTARTKLAGVDGSRPSGGDTLPSRLVVFDIEIFDGRTYDEGGTLAVEEAADVLKAAWAPVRSGVTQLELELANGPRILYGRPIEVEIDGSDMLFGKARARLVFEATDPRFYASTVDSNVLGLTEGGGMTFPLTFPLVFGASSDSGAAAVNAGTIEAPWTATITGPMTDCRLVLAETAAEVVIDGEVPAGSTLVLSSADRSVLLDGSPRQSWLTLSSRWWQLSPGSNTVRFRAASGSGTCTFSWRSTWL